MFLTVFSPAGAYLYEWWLTAHTIEEAVGGGIDYACLVDRRDPGDGAGHDKTDHQSISFFS